MAAVEKQRHSRARSRSIRGGAFPAPDKSFPALGHRPGPPFGPETISEIPLSCGNETHCPTRPSSKQGRDIMKGLLEGFLETVLLLGLIVVIAMASVPLCWRPS